MNCGNQAAENGRKKKLWQPKNCGNDIAKIEGGRGNVAIDLWKWHVEIEEKKRGNWFVAMELPK